MEIFHFNKNVKCHNCQLIFRKYFTLEEWLEKYDIAIINFLMNMDQICSTVPSRIPDLFEISLSNNDQLYATTMTKQFIVDSVEI